MAASMGAVVSVEEVLAVALFTAVVVSVVDVSRVAVSMAGTFMGNVSEVTVSTAVAFVATVLVITDSLMMSSSAATGIRGGGAGTIHTDITITAITRTITMAMDTADIRMVTMAMVATRTAMDTAGTVTTAAAVMAIATEAERVMDMVMAAKPVMHIAMAAHQDMAGVSGVGDNPTIGVFEGPPWYRG